MQHRDHDRLRMFTRRAVLLATAQGLMFGGLAARMYYLQVVDSDRYRLLAEENRINMRLLPPPRGRIVDRFLVPLADNQQNYRVLLTAENAPDVAKTLDRLAYLIPLSEGERARVLREARRKRKFVPITVAEFLGWEEVAQLQANAPDLSGISIDVGERRHYPFGAHASHIVGYVGAVSERELTGDPLLELPGFRIGKSGVEGQYDLALRGGAGRVQLEVNAVGRVIRELERQEGQRGHDLVTTLDVVLQQLANERLGEQSGAVVVLDVRTGDVLALASTPAYDPNEFASGVSNSTWKALVDSEKAPLRNKAIAGEYAPGSTFKMVVALAALEAGVIDASTRFFCNGKLELGDDLFHCWKRHGHGHVGLVRGIRESCDVYFYEIAGRTGIDRIAEMARRLGLGDHMAFDVPGERAGLIPTRAWKLARRGQPWVKGETLVAGIGQGFVLATPLQLAVMSARLASGRAVMPHIARDTVEDDRVAARAADEFAAVEINTYHMDLVRKGMEEAVNHARGTGWDSRLRLEDETITMAGKTATAQVRRITRDERAAGVRKNEELPRRFRDHALFVSYAPVSDPRYAVAVVVEHGGGGAKVAAPIGRDVLEECLKRDPGSTAPGAGLAAVPADAPGAVRG